MLKPLFFFLICFSVCNSFCQPLTAQQLRFHPADSLAYQIIIDGGSFKMDIKVAGAFQYKNDSIKADWLIQKIQYKDGSKDEAAYNRDLQHASGTHQEMWMNNRGKILSNSHTQKLINTDLLVAEFPEGEIKLNDTWQVKRSAKPDIIFDSLQVYYTCKEITATHTKLAVKMIFLQSPVNKTPDVNFTKQFEGYYLVDNKTGTVVEADLKISGFNGISRMSGGISIRRLAN
ncbi:MAG: hypothetical protein NTW29_19820 [Bacteroidetes bacterium]|nr:hypothetical protein [Bacteroidota bacterium]